MLEARFAWELAAKVQVIQKLFPAFPASFSRLLEFSGCAGKTHELLWQTRPPSCCPAQRRQAGEDSQNRGAGQRLAKHLLQHPPCTG